MGAPCSYKACHRVIEQPELPPRVHCVLRGHTKSDVPVNVSFDGLLTAAKPLKRERPNCNSKSDHSLKKADLWGLPTSPCRPNIIVC